MAKVFSWKINDKEYSYLFIPDKKTHISERIIDADIINKMIDKVSSWDEKKYKNAFDQMNLELAMNYGLEIPYNPSFFNENKEKNNIVILGSSSSEKNDLEELKKEIMNEVDERFKVILKEFNNLYNELLNKFNKQTIDVIKIAKDTEKNTLDSLKTIKDEVEKRFDKSAEKFEKATKVLDLENNGINTESLKDLFRVTNKIDKWMGEVSDNVKKISTEYNNFKRDLTEDEIKKGVFKTIKDKIDKTNLSIDEIKIDSKVIKEDIKILNKKEQQKNVTIKNIDDIPKFDITLRKD